MTDSLSQSSFPLTVSNRLICPWLIPSNLRLRRVLTEAVWDGEVLYRGPKRVARGGGLRCPSRPRLTSPPASSNDTAARAGGASSWRDHGRNGACQTESLSYPLQRLWPLSCAIVYRPRVILTRGNGATTTIIRNRAIEWSSGP